MKRILTLIFCLVSVVASGQCYPDVTTINFDGDTCYKQVLIIDTVNYKHNVWQIGKPNKTVFTSAFTSPNAIVTDTIHQFPQADTSVFLLRLPCWRYFNGAWWPMLTLQFYHSLDIDTGIRVAIEVTSDTLHNWVNVKNDTLPYDFYFEFPVPNLDSSTPGGQLTTLTRPLAAMFAGRKYYDTMLFRFTIISDSGVHNKDGWMLDGFWIEYYAESVPLLQNPTLITLYPNPSHGNIYIHSDKPHKDAMITIHNIQGQQVYSGVSLAGGYLNLQLPNGIYTLRYSDEEEYCVKQIVIQN